MEMSRFSDRVERWKEPVLWAVSSALATVFVVAGGAKILALDALAANFERWGYPAWTMIAIGLVELANAGLLLTRKYAFFGASALGVVMLGAYVTHAVHGETAGALIAVALFAVLFAVALARVPADLRNWWNVRRGAGTWGAQGT